MLEQVERKIEEFEQAKRNAYYKEKEANLISWGLTTKTKGNKDVPIVVTDEEYEALLEAARGTAYSGKSKTKMATVLTAVAIAIAVIGMIVGIALYISSDNLKMVSLGLSWVGALALCCLFLGIAELINLSGNK